jgi:hypothetical protein
MSNYHAGNHEHLPAVPREAVTPLDLLTEHKETLVEQPDLLHCLSPDEKTGAPTQSTGNGRVAARASAW